MLHISLLGLSTQDFIDAAALGVPIWDNHNLFEGDDEFFEENPFEDLHDQACILRGHNGEPVAHMPKVNNKCPRCAEKGIEQFVLPGKHCPRCNQPC